MTIALIVIGTLVVIVGAIEAAKRMRHPEQTAGHGDVPADTIDDRFYRTVDRPAGPDAEEPVDPSTPAAER